ncbi:hypothetical protein GCM10027062_00950 [Nocardioides hungaricus]
MAVGEPELGLRAPEPEARHEDPPLGLEPRLGARVGEVDRGVHDPTAGPAPHRRPRLVEVEAGRAPAQRRVAAGDARHQPVLAGHVQGGARRVERAQAVDDHDLLVAVRREVVLHARPDRVAVDLAPRHMDGGGFGVGHAETVEERGRVVAEHVLATEHLLGRADAEERSPTVRVEAPPDRGIGVHPVAEADEHAVGEKPPEVGIAEAGPGSGAAGEESVLVEWQVSVEGHPSRSSARVGCCRAGNGSGGDPGRSVRLWAVCGPVRAAGCNAGLLLVPTVMQPGGNKE